MLVLEDKLDSEFFANFRLNNARFQISFVSAFDINCLKKIDLLIYVFDTYDRQFHLRLIEKIDHLKSRKTLLVYYIHSFTPFGELLKTFKCGTMDRKNYGKIKKHNLKTRFKRKFKTLKEHFTAGEIVYFFNRVVFPNSRIELTKQYIVSYFSANEISADDIWLLYSYEILNAEEIIPLIKNMKYGWWFENNINDLFSIYENNDVFYQTKYPNTYFLENNSKTVPFSSLSK